MVETLGAGHGGLRPQPGNGGALRLGGVEEGGDQRFADATTAGVGSYGQEMHLELMCAGDPARGPATGDEGDGAEQRARRIVCAEREPTRMDRVRSEERGGTGRVREAGGDVGVVEQLLKLRVVARAAGKRLDNELVDHARRHSALCSAASG
ncbi:hypothetical protein MASR1M101_12700 [Gemmatimonas sp.]